MKRTLKDRNCEFCADLFRPRRREQKFCSKECSGKFRRSFRVKTCALCRKSVLKKPSELKNSKSGLFFCNRSCKDKAQQIGGLKEIQPEYYKDGSRWYRQRALREYGALCKSCGYFTSEKMLDVDHINEDRSDNRIENLQVLCVWCHAIKTRKVPYHNRGR